MSGVTWVRIGLTLGLGLMACGAGAAELPRVFFTPAERAAISAQRFAGRPFAAESATLVASGAPAPAAVTAVAPRARRIDGVTVGRDAQPVAWIGGERIADGSSWGEYRVRVERDGVRLIATDGSMRRLRVGMELPP
jgi:hypothetical protein